MDPDTHPPDRALLRAVLLARQAATLLTLGGFATLAPVIDEPWTERFLAMVTGFWLLGFAFWVVARAMDPRRLLVVLLVVDAAFVSITIALTPYPAEFAMTYLAITTVASISLSTRAAIAVTSVAVVMGVGATALFGRPEELAPLAAAMVILGSLSVVLIVVRRQERRIRLRLERSQLQLARAERVAGLGSWQWCPSTGELIWSPQMFRISGRDPDGPPAGVEDWLRSLPAVVRTQFEELIAEALENGTDYEIDIPIEETDSTPRRVVQARGSRMVEEQGKVWLVGTTQDVTELRRVEDLKDEFVATASHELRTPATIILGFVRTLDDRWHDLDDSQRQRLIRELRRGGERLSRLIEDVLSISRIEHGALGVDPHPVDVASQIQEAIDQLGDARVVASFDERLHDVRVMADPERLRQVLYNLLDNALRYDGHGGLVHVDVEPADSDGGATHLVVRVRDHGPGVAPADRERIFGRFVRGAHPPSGAPGTGLGLYVSRALTRRQGGDMWVEDARDGSRGSVFCFTVPLAQESRTAHRR